MESQNKTTITVETTVNAPVKKVWEYWTMPVHITKWSYATEEWHTPRADNDLRVGGHFSSRMEAKDGSMGFDFGGVYDDVKEDAYIAYTMGDGRKVEVKFAQEGNGTRIIESFEPEGMNPAEMQRAGWQAILDNFRKYTETH